MVIRGFIVFSTCAIIKLGPSEFCLSVYLKGHLPHRLSMSFPDHQKSEKLLSFLRMTLFPSLSGSYRIGDVLQARLLACSVSIYGLFKGKGYEYSAKRITSSPQ